MRRHLALLAITVLVIPVHTFASGVEELRASFEVEARILDQRIGAYASAREQERRAILELQRLNSDLDFALEDPNAAASELRSLDQEVAMARDRVISESAESASKRREMLQQMGRLAEVIRQFERAGVDLVGRSDAVGGLWQVEADPNDVTGLLDLQQEGTFVRGTFRMSNGVEGSVSGTFAGGRLELVLVDSEHGNVGSIVGTLDAEEGEILGTWHAREVGRGRPSSGEWVARRVALDEQLRGDR